MGGAATGDEAYLNPMAFPLPATGWTPADQSGIPNLPMPLPDTAMTGMQIPDGMDFLDDLLPPAVRKPVSIRGRTHADKT